MTLVPFNLDELALQDARLQLNRAVNRHDVNALAAWARDLGAAVLDRAEEACGLEEAA